MCTIDICIFTYQYVYIYTIDIIMYLYVYIHIPNIWIYNICTVTYVYCTAYTYVRSYIICISAIQEDVLNVIKLIFDWSEIWTESQTAKPSIGLYRTNILRNYIVSRGIEWFHKPLISIEKLMFLTLQILKHSAALAFQTVRMLPVETASPDAGYLHIPHRFYPPPNFPRIHPRHRQNAPATISVGVAKKKNSYCEERARIEMISLWRYVIKS